MTYVFDLDGTLIDSRARHYLLMKDILIRNGVLISKCFASDFMRYKAEGKSGLSYLTEVLHMEEMEAQGIHSEWVGRIEEYEWLRYDTLYPDAEEMCKRCECIGKVFFLTGRKNQVGLLNELERLGIARYAKKVFVVDPAWAEAEKANVLRGISMNDPDCIMIGDTEVDYHAAKAAGTKYYLLNRGFRGREYWNRAGIESFDGLRDLPL